MSTEFEPFNSTTFTEDLLSDIALVDYSTLRIVDEAERNPPSDSEVVPWRRIGNRLDEVARNGFLELRRTNERFEVYTTRKGELAVAGALVVWFGDLERPFSQAVYELLLKRIGRHDLNNNQAAKDLVERTNQERNLRARFDMVRALLAIPRE